MFDIIKKKGGINKYRVGCVHDKILYVFFRIFHLDICISCHMKRL